MQGTQGASWLLEESAKRIRINSLACGIVQFTTTYLFENGLSIHLINIYFSKFLKFKLTFTDFEGSLLFPEAIVFRLQ